MGERKVNTFKPMQFMLKRNTEEERKTEYKSGMAIDLKSDNTNIFTFDQLACYLLEGWQENPSQELISHERVLLRKGCQLLMLGKKMRFTVKFSSQAKVKGNENSNLTAYNLYLPEPLEASY